MSSPRISICIPLYNGAATIGQLLQSITTQSFRDFQVIIADDVSTDESLHLVEPFLRDPRFRLVRRPQNLGFSENLIELIKEADATDFIVFPGQDDAWTEDFLRAHIEALDTHPEAAVAHSRCQLIDAKGAPLQKEAWYWDRLKPVMSGADLIESLMTHNYVCFPAAVIRRRALDEIKAELFKTRFNYVPDWWMWLLLAGKGWSFVYLKHADCLYRIHAAQLTETLSPALKTAEMSLILVQFSHRLDGKNFGQQLSPDRRRALYRLTTARLLRRGAALMLNSMTRGEGIRLVKIALFFSPSLILRFPFYLARYLRARSRQRRDCAGMPELFHPLGAR